MLAWVRLHDCDIVVLAGYDRVLSEEFVRPFAGRILNLHNSLLPAFGGTMDAVRLALQGGVKVTGCTVHFVEAGAVDAGPIVLQAAVPVLDQDTEASLLERIHEQEWRILPEAVRLLALGLLERRGRRVTVRCD